MVAKKEETQIMKKTAVIILNWNGQKLLEQFLPTVLQHTLNEETKVVLADNGSTDNSVAYMQSAFPNVKLIAFSENHGFAEGYNRAINQVDAEYVVLLNSDIETTENWLIPMIEYLDRNPDFAAVQPKILDYKRKTHFEYAGAAGGFIDRYGYPFCRGRILESVEEDSGQYDDVIPIFWATGAALCIRKKEYEEAGGLDGRFFAHMEEIDLCWRLNARGKKIACVPQSAVYHVGGASLSMESPRKSYLNFRNNLLMLYKNLPSEKFLRVFSIRMFLDFLAMMHLVVQGKSGNAAAVARSHRDFHRMKPDFRKNRRKNLQKSTGADISTRYDHSILWNYYLKGRKTYASIFKKR